MPKRSSKEGPKGPRDPNVVAWEIVQQVTGQSEPESTQPAKNAAAVSLGRLGGLKGGKARASMLTPEKRAEIAKKAAEKRWAGRS